MTGRAHDKCTLLFCAVDTTLKSNNYQCFRSQHEDEIEAYYKQRFGDSSATDRFGEGEEMSDEITQQGRLPGVK